MIFALTQSLQPKNHRKPEWMRSTPGMRNIFKWSSVGYRKCLVNAWCLRPGDVADSRSLIHESMNPWIFSYYYCDRVWGVFGAKVPFEQLECQHVSLSMCVWVRVCVRDFVFLFLHRRTNATDNLNTLSNMNELQLAIMTLRTVNRTDHIYILPNIMWYRCQTVWTYIKSLRQPWQYCDNNTEARYSEQKIACTSNGSSSRSCCDLSLRPSKHTWQQLVLKKAIHTWPFKSL